jgi:hypothetical protein
MSKEVEVFFLSFFDVVQSIKNKHEKNLTGKLYYAELDAWKNLNYELLELAREAISKNKDCDNDSSYFHNNIINSFNMCMNADKITDFVKSRIICADAFCAKSKELISYYLNMVLLPNFVFEKDDNIKRTKLYFRKLFMPVILRWKMTNGSDDYEHINNLNKIIEKNNNNIRYNNSADYSQMLWSMANLEEDTVLELINFLEDLTKKYEKLDALEKTKNELIARSKIPEAKIEAIDKPVKSKTVIKKIVTKVVKDNGFEEDDNKKNDEPQIIKKKKTIPKKVKQLVWNLHMGEENGKGKCCCCGSTEISQMDFQCGHIVSEYNGGDIVIDNLLPICSLCNTSMGKTNMDEFIKKHGLHKNNESSIKIKSKKPETKTEVTIKN